MKNDTHTQCKFRLEEGSTQWAGRTLYEVTWIETKFAERNKRLRIEGLDGIWVVEEVWSTRPTKWVKDGERDYLKQRKASDI